MNYYNEIKNKLIDNEVYSKVKDYSKERYKVITYFEIGKILTEAGGKYGDNIIDEYAKEIGKEEELIPTSIYGLEFYRKLGYDFYNSDYSQNKDGEYILSKRFNKRKKYNKIKIWYYAQKIKTI